MNKPITSKLSVVALAALVLSACSSLPPGNPVLDDARAVYSAADRDPRTREFAAGELMQAKSTLDRADRALSNGDKPARVEQLAHEARQQASIATQVAQRKSAEQMAAQANADRDKIRLDARTREADQARMSAEVAQSQAQSAQTQAMVAQAQAEAARREAETATSAAAQTQARNSALVILLQEMQAKKTERGMVVTINDVLFDTNRAELKSGGLRSIEKLGALLKDDPARRVQVEGFTDSTGSPATNEALSARRAESVRSALLGQGVPADRVSARGLGESYPVASNDNAAGRQMNRRVEIILSDENGKVAQR